jgi:hypothetical protein
MERGLSPPTKKERILDEGGSTEERRKSQSDMNSRDAQQYGYRAKRHRDANALSNC